MCENFTKAAIWQMQLVDINRIYIYGTYLLKFAITDAEFANSHAKA